MGVMIYLVARSSRYSFLHSNPYCFALVPIIHGMIKYWLSRILILLQFLISFSHSNSTSSMALKTAPASLFTRNLSLSNPSSWINPTSVSIVFCSFSIACSVLRQTWALLKPANSSSNFLIWVRICWVSLTMAESSKEYVSFCGRHEQQLPDDTSLDGLLQTYLLEKIGWGSHSAPLVRQT